MSYEDPTGEDIKVMLLVGLVLILISALLS